MPPLNLGGITVYSALDALNLYAIAPEVPAAAETVNGESNSQHSKAEWFAWLVTSAVAVR